MSTFDVLWQEVAELDPVEGFTPVHLLSLPDAFRSMFRKMLRQGALSVDTLATELELTPDQAQALAELFVRKGFLLTELQANGDGIAYRLRMVRTQC